MSYEETIAKLRAETRALGTMAAGDVWIGSGQPAGVFAVQECFNLHGRVLARLTAVLKTLGKERETRKKVSARIDSANGEKGKTMLPGWNLQIVLLDRSIESHEADVSRLEALLSEVLGLEKEIEGQSKFKS